MRIPLVKYDNFHHPFLFLRDFVLLKVRCMAFRKDFVLTFTEVYLNIKS